MTPAERTRRWRLAQPAGYWRRYTSSFQKAHERRKQRWREDPSINRRRRARQIYGITLEQYESLLARGCAICGSHEKICLDHDHAKGVIRAGLCQDCNRGLGFFRDDMDRLRRAADYLEVHETLFEQAH